MFSSNIIFGSYHLVFQVILTISWLLVSEFQSILIMIFTHNTLMFIQNGVKNTKHSANPNNHGL